MTRDDLFNINAGIVKDLIVAVAKYSPKAYILVISNPVNSTVPIAAEVLKKAGVFDPKRLFGVTTLDVVRAETFVEEVTGTKTSFVPVVGGHSGNTIVPLFSQTKPAVDIPADKLDALVNRVQFGGDEVVKAKDGLGSATLSMAYAGFRFAEALLKAAKGEKGIVEPTFVYLPGVEGGEAIAKETGTDFFSVPVSLGVSIRSPVSLSTTSLLRPPDVRCGRTSADEAFFFSPAERKRPSTSSRMPTATRKSSWMRPSKDSRRTLKLASTSSRGHRSRS